MLYLIITRYYGINLMTIFNFRHALHNQQNKTLIYVCVDNSCKLPLSEVEMALRLIKD